jgi:Ca2+-binding RTX toxin-like protein
MMRSVFSRRYGIDRAHPVNRDHKMRSRRLQALVECLESRDLMTGGSVVQSGALVTVTPAPTGPNTAVVSYQNHQGTTMLDVNLNGTDNFYSLSQVGFVYYLGSGASGAQTFQDNTSLHVVAYGGSGTNLFEGGSGQDDFYGGSGSNTFDAGSGYDFLIGGVGANVFNENSTGSGLIMGVGNNNTINGPTVASESYMIYGAGLS